MAKWIATHFVASATVTALLLTSSSYAQSGDDPDAWARMLGPNHKHQQQQATGAVSQYVQQQHEVDAINASMLAAATSQPQRDEIVRAIEEVYAKKLGVDAYVVSSAYYIVQGQSYVICGAGTFVKDGVEYTGSFIFNPRPNGIKAVNATREMANQNGCFSDAGFALRE